MKFLVDAQLPRHLAGWLREAGHEASHTLDLPNGNRTTNAEITALSTWEQSAVVTKDADFVRSHLLSGEPRKLLLISTGNITNAALRALLMPNLPAIVAAFGTENYLELTRTSLFVHA